MAKLVKDPELLAMSRITTILADLNDAQRARVLAWVLATQQEAREPRQNGAAVGS